MPGPQALAVASAMRQLIQQTLRLNGVTEPPPAELGPPWEDYAPGTEPQHLAGTSTLIPP